MQTFILGFSDWFLHLIFGNFVLRVAAFVPSMIVWRFWTAVSWLYWSYIILTMNSSVKIISMNCHGLADPHKRRDVFHYFRKKSYSIYLLQDTHFDPKIENCIRAEWGYKCHFASYNSSSRGVAILFIIDLNPKWKGFIKILLEITYLSL